VPKYNTSEKGKKEQGIRERERERESDNRGYERENSHRG
jgi:hypothetical protein